MLVICRQHSFTLLLALAPLTKVYNVNAANLTCTRQTHFITFNDIIGVMRTKRGNTLSITTAYCLYLYILYVCNNYAPYSQLITIVVVPFVSVRALSAL